MRNDFYGLGSNVKFSTLLKIYILNNIHKKLIKKIKKILILCILQQPLSITDYSAHKDFHQSFLRKKYYGKF